MNCGNCGTAIPAGAAFCPKCGAKLAAAAVAPAPPATGAEALRQKAADIRAAGADPETALWHGGFSPKAMLGYWILAIVITVVAFAAAFLAPPPLGFVVAAGVTAAVWIGMILYLVFQRLSVDYQLTTQRLIHRRGILSRTTGRVEVIDIDDVQVEQGFVERMIGVGTIRLLSTDISDPKLVMLGIDNVNQVATLIDTTRRDERRKRGLHIETV